MAWSRTSRQSRGYGAEWDKIRARILRRDKHLCQECKRRGQIRTGNHVDHIKPKAKGGTDADDNLQTLCRQHHDEKTLADRGGTVRQAIGTDGWPIDR